MLLGSETWSMWERMLARLAFASGDVGRHRLAAWLLVLELGAQAPSRRQDQVRLGSIGAICSDGSRRVLAVEHLAELRAVDAFIGIVRLPPPNRGTADTRASGEQAAGLPSRGRSGHAARV